MTKCKIFPQWGRDSGWWNFRDTRILPFANYFLPGPHYEQPRTRDVMVMVQHLCDVAYLFVRPERQTSSSVRAQTFDFRNPEPPKWGKQQNKKPTDQGHKRQTPSATKCHSFFPHFLKKLQPYARRNVNPAKSRTFGPIPKDRDFSPSFRLLFVPLAFFFFSLMSKVCGRSEGESGKKQHTHTRLPPIMQKLQSFCRGVAHVASYDLLSSSSRTRSFHPS